MRFLKIHGENGKAKFSCEYPIEAKKMAFHSILFNYENLVEITKTTFMSIRNEKHIIEKGLYQLQNLSPNQKVVFSFNDKRKVEVFGNTHFYLDEGLCNDLGLNYVPSSYELEGNKPIVFGVKYYFNIPENCNFETNLSNGNKVFKSFEPGKYSLGGILRELMVDSRNEVKIKVNDSFHLEITAKQGFKINETLSKVLGFKVSEPSKCFEVSKAKSYYTIISDYVPSMIREPLIEGLIGQIVIHNYGVIRFDGSSFTKTELIQYCKPLVDINFDESKILLRSQYFFEIDKSICERFHLEPKTEFKMIPIKSLPIVSDKNKLYEIHCNIVRKSLTSSSNYHLEEEIVGIFTSNTSNYITEKNLNFISLDSHLHNLVIKIQDIDSKSPIGKFVIYFLLL